MLPTHIDVRSTRSLQPAIDDVHDKAHASGSEHDHPHRGQRRWENDGPYSSHRPPVTGKLTKKKSSHGQDWKQIRQHNLPPRMRVNSSTSSSGHGHGSLNYSTTSPSQTNPGFTTTEQASLLNRSALVVENGESLAQDTIYRTEAKTPFSVGARSRSAISKASTSLATLPSLSLSPPVDGLSQQLDIPIDPAYSGGNPLTTPASYLQPQPLAVIHHHHYHHHYHGPEESPTVRQAKSRSNSVSTTVPATTTGNGRPARNLPPRLQNRTSNPDLKVGRKSGTVVTTTTTTATLTTAAPAPTSSVTSPTTWNGFVTEELPNEELDEVLRTSGSRNAIPAYHSHLMNLRLTSPLPGVTSKVQSEGWEESEWRRQSMIVGSGPPPSTNVDEDAISVAPNMTKLRRNGSIRRPAGSGSMKLRRYSALLQSTTSIQAALMSGQPDGRNGAAFGMVPVRELDYEASMEGEERSPISSRGLASISSEPSLSQYQAQATTLLPVLSSRTSNSAPTSASSCETGETSYESRTWETGTWESGGSFSNGTWESGPTTPSRSGSRVRSSTSWKPGMDDCEDDDHHELYSYNGDVHIVSSSSGHSHEGEELGMGRPELIYNSASRDFRGVGGLLEPTLTYAHRRYPSTGSSATASASSESSHAVLTELESLSLDQHRIGSRGPQQREHGEGELDEGSVADHGHEHGSEADNHDSVDDDYRFSDDRSARNTIVGVPATLDSHLRISAEQVSKQQQPANRRSSWWKDNFTTPFGAISSTPFPTVPPLNSPSPAPTHRAVGVIGDKWKMPIRPTLTPTQSSERFKPTTPPNTRGAYLVPDLTPMPRTSANGFAVQRPAYLPNPSFDPFRSET